METSTNHVFLKNSAQPHISYAFTQEMLTLLNCTESDTAETVLSKLEEVKEKAHAKRVKNTNNIICRVSVNMYTDEYLDLSRHDINDEIVELLVDALKDNSYVKTVDLYYNKISDNGARLLSELELKGLNLSCNSIGVEGCKWLSRSKIEELDLSANLIGAEGASYFSESKNIQKLILNECDIGDLGARQVLSNRNIRILHLNTNDVTDEGMRNLPLDSNLEILSLSQNDIGDYGSNIIAGHKNLERIFLNSNSITDKGVCGFVGNYNVKLLDLSQNYGITNVGFVELCKNRSIKELYVINTSIEIESIDVLPENSMLEKLYFGYGSKRDVGVDDLMWSKLSQLKKISS